jgi:hypothetical protein
MDGGEPTNMGYDSLIKSQVKRAFSSIKDLAKTVTLSQSSNAGFNFTTGEVGTVTTTTKTVKAVIINKKRKDDVNAAIETEMLINAADLDDPTIYDTVTISGVVWNMITPYNNDGYTITIKIVRGG